MARADKIKRAVCELAFHSMDWQRTLFVPRNAEPNSPYDELEYNFANSGELFRVLRVKMGDAVPPRYFEIRVREMQ